MLRSLLLLWCYGYDHGTARTCTEVTSVLRVVEATMCISDQIDWYTTIVDVTSIIIVVFIQRDRVVL